MPRERLELFRMANMVYGDRVEAHLNIGSSLAGLGDMEGSIEAWRSAIAVIESPDVDPGDPETREQWDSEYWIMAHSNLGILLPTVGRPEEAVVVLETILERYPDNAEARSSLALALSQAGQGDDALGIFDEILARDDAAPLDYFNAGVSLYGADQMDRAVLAFEKTIARSPMYRDGIQNLAQTLNLLEDYEAQIPHSEEARRVGPLQRLRPAAAYKGVGPGRAGTGCCRPARDHAGLTLRDRQSPAPAVGYRLQPYGRGHKQGVGTRHVDHPALHLLRQRREPVGTADTEVAVTVPDVAHTFAVTFEGEIQVLGYSYELVG